MTKFIRLLILVFFLPFYALGGDEYQDNIRYSPIPDWVENTEYKVNTDSNSSEGAVRYLLVDSQVNLTEGQHSDYFRVVQKVENRQGLSQASELFFGFNPDYQTLDIHQILVVRDGKVVDQTNIELNTMRQEQDLSSNIITGQVTSLAILEDVQEGDIIDYAFSVHGSNPVFNDKKFLQVTTSWLVNVDYAKVIVKTDISRPLNHKVTGTDTKIQTHKTDAHLIYRWEDKDIQAEASEQDYPRWYQHFDKLEFSEFDTWQDVARWATDLYNIEITPNQELVAMNQKWREEAVDDLDYVKRVVSFVQNEIRYFGIELSENSHKPRAPHLVFERRYGDCKDKSLMISWLLAQYDIQSWSALVSAYNREGVEEQLPSPGVFDHVINKIIVDGQVFWIDGTNMGQQGQLAEFSTNQFGRALIIDNASESLDDMSQTEMVPWKNYLKETFTSKGYDQEVDLEFTITLTGQEAQYSKMTLESEGKSYVADNILDYYKRQFPSGEWRSELVIDNKSDESHYEMHGRIAIPDYWDGKEHQFVVPLYGEHLSTYLSLPEQISRVTPLANYKNIEVKHHITFIMHEAIDWNLEDKNMSFANEAFNYNRSITTKSDVLIVDHAYKPISRHINTHQMPEYVEKIKAAREALYYSVVINNKGSEKNKLRNRMRSLLKL